MPIKTSLEKQESTLSVADRQLYGCLWGSEEFSDEQPLVVLLHDALGSVIGWRDFPEVLAKHLSCPVFAYDRFGSGRSDGLLESRDVDYLHKEALEILPQVLKTFNDRPIILLGHSDGGSIALMFASQWADQFNLQAVISVAAHVFVEDITLQGIRAAVTHAQHSDFLDKLARFHGSKTEALFSAWHETWCSEAFREWNIESYLPDVRVPVLVLQGEDDEYGTAAQVDTIARKVSGLSEQKIFYDCHHVPHYEQRQQALKAINEFVEQNGLIKS